jgi:hypothetical protein
MADDSKRDADASIATDAQNARLEHSQGGATTRDDALDAGVPMLPGDPSEPQGPEDALGPGPKRGDYSGRVGPEGYQPHRSEPIPDAERERDDDGNVIGPSARLVAQRPSAANQGEVAGVKGGVGTTEATESATPARRSARR